MISSSDTMKQKTLYIVLVICLIIISILSTLFISNYQKLQPNRDSTIDKPKTYIYSQNYGYPVYDTDYAYDYDGYWFQPSRWWDNLWNYDRYDRHDRHRYNRRRDYDRRDGLDIHNRYNNQINITSQPNLPRQSQPPPPQLPQPPASQPPPPESQLPPPPSQPIISLVRQNTDFPLPTLYSSAPIMPEEISMSPLQNPNQSGFTSVPLNESNFTDQNHNPLPIDIMASQAIALESQ